MCMHGITFFMHPICHTIIIVNFTGTPPTCWPCDIIRKLSIKKQVIQLI